MEYQPSSSNIDYLIGPKDVFVPQPVPIGKALCHHPCHCGKPVPIGKALCHHPCHCDTAVPKNADLCKK